MDPNIARARLECWTSPHRFSQFQDQIACEVGDVEFWQRNWKFAREAWIASKLAKDFQPQQIKITTKDREQNFGPDFEFIARDGRRIRFQATELIRSGRKRKLEYEAWQDDGYRSQIGGEFQHIRSSAALHLLEQLVEKKSKKHYSDMSLVVYANIDVDIDNDFVSGFSKACAPGQGKFQSIWILWGKRVYRGDTKLTGVRSELVTGRGRELGWAVMTRKRQQQFEELFSRKQ